MYDHPEVLPLAQAARLRALVNAYGSPLFVYDAQALRSAYQALSVALPSVRLHYAIKALPLPQVLRDLHALGSAFDVATCGELDLLRAEHVPAQQCIHTHPMKSAAEIRAALRFGCTTFVVDNVDEMGKFVRYRQRVGLLLRVSLRASDAVVDLSRKYGCMPTEVLDLLEHARGLGLQVKGLSFHVGSQCASASAHVRAIETCGSLIRAARERGHALGVLDIGGGFPAAYDGLVDLDAFCAPIRRALCTLPADLDLWAEPGRVLAAPAAQSIARVVGRARRGEVNWYYLDDGVYGSYSGQIYDHARYPLAILNEGGRSRAVLAGPTCDSIDVIAEDILLPRLELGDIVVGRMMGAYTWASASTFNSLRLPQVVNLADPRPRLECVA